jgi:peptide chain release factor subunit 1
MGRPERPSVIILTPVKNASSYLDSYVERLNRLDWPRDRLSVGLLESDSTDGTWDKLRGLKSELSRRARRVTLVKRDFGFKIPEGMPRWAPGIQLVRRGILARARNQLLSRALRNEEWVLWLDVDVIEFPPDIIPRLLATRFDIVHPHCVKRPGGPTFDLNAWSDHGAKTLDDLRGREAVRLDAVGGTMLLVKADLHRDGLIFPPFRYGLANPRVRPHHPIWGQGEVETEGFGIMAQDMGAQCWGLPELEILHASD